MSSKPFNVPPTLGLLYDICIPRSRNILQVATVVDLPAIRRHDWGIVRAVKRPGTPVNAPQPVKTFPDITRGGRLRVRLRGGGRWGQRVKVSSDQDVVWGSFL